MDGSAAPKTAPYRVTDASSEEEAGRSLQTLAQEGSDAARSEGSKEFGQVDRIDGERLRRERRTDAAGSTRAALVSQRLGKAGLAIRKLLIFRAVLNGLFIPVRMGTADFMPMLMKLASDLRSSNMMAGSTRDHRRYRDTLHRQSGDKHPHDHKSEHPLHSQSLFDCGNFSQSGTLSRDRAVGKSRGRRRVQGGRFDMRRVLYMATPTAARHNRAIKAFYERLRTTGKLSKVVVVACMRKLLTTLNAMVRTNKPCDKSFHRA